MSQSEKPFSVSDRRHFTPEGQPRDEDAREAPETPAGAADPVASTPEPPNATGAAADAEGGAIDFAQFLLSLGAQAGALLSQGGQADAGKADEALAGARSLISILEMLRDKTEGRRTPDEERVIDGLLFELRMAYVERSRKKP